MKLPKTKLKPMYRDVYVKTCPKCAYVAQEKDYDNEKCWFCDTPMLLTDKKYIGVTPNGKWSTYDWELISYLVDLRRSTGVFDHEAEVARDFNKVPHWPPRPQQPTTPTTPTTSTTPPTLTTCPVCGGKVSSAAPACPHCGQPMKEPEPTPVAAPQPVKPVEEKNVPKCPTCGSTNIRRVDGLERSMSFFLWGFGSRKVNKSYKCLHCDYTW